jgi:hypothetical protein
MKRKREREREREKEKEKEKESGDIADGLVCQYVSLNHESHTGHVQCSLA